TWRAASHSDISIASAKDHLRTGYGIKNKTLEAMSAGVPVAGSGSRALRANRIDEYMEAISTLFEDSQLRSTLSRSARVYVEREFTWEQAGVGYEQVLKG
ncbi:MAG: hypothetical protein ACO3EZ_12995, partial [Prochlorotrichaceae cyanobacterium]